MIQLNSDREIILARIRTELLTYQARLQEARAVIQVLPAAAELLAQMIFSLPGLHETAGKEVQKADDDLNRWFEELHETELHVHAILDIIEPLQGVAMEMGEDLDVVSYIETQYSSSETPTSFAMERHALH